MSGQKISKRYDENWPRGEAAKSKNSRKKGPRFIFCCNFNINFGKFQKFAH